MVKAKYMVTIVGSAFGENDFSCLGQQLAQIVIDLDKQFKNITWYVVDVDASQIIPDRLRTKAFPRKVGSSSIFEREVRKIDQYISGVFLWYQVLKKIPNLEINPKQRMNYLKN